MKTGKGAVLAAMLLAAPLCFGADTVRSSAPTGLKARAASDAARKACYVDCKREKDTTAYERCMIDCNKTYPLSSPGKGPLRPR